jgi:uncharacterized protein (DUF1778 family)
MAISVRVNEADEKLIKKYAEMKRQTVSDVLRDAILEKIEDEIDIETYRRVMEEHRKNPVTYSHEEAWAMLERQD